MAAKKKALAVLFSTRTLYDFIWFYSTYGLEYDWDVLIKAYGKKVEIKELCERSGLFKNIYCDGNDFSDESIISKVTFFIKILFACVFRKKKTYAKNLIEKTVPELRYELHCIAPSETLMFGAFGILSSDVTTILLEDGMCDYYHRGKKWEKDFPLNERYISSYIFAKLGIADFVSRFDMDYYANCDKLSFFSERLEYRKYKSIKKLRDFSETNIEKYTQILNRTFELEKDCGKAEVVLYTVPLSDYSEDPENEIQQTAKYLIDNYKNRKVILKRHPRDKGKYIFPEELSVQECDYLIPAELLGEMDNIKHHIFMFPSTTLQVFDKKKHIEILHYNSLEKKVNVRNYSKVFRDNITSLQMDDRKVEI